MSIEKQIEKMWYSVWKDYFYEKTSLIYDFRVDYECDSAISDLPTADEISMMVPNGCSWNTGMEDSMIHGGMMLDVIIKMYNKTGDSTLSEYAEKIFAGIKKCSYISGISGFLARSISPYDEKSFYLDSSRDQYTLSVYRILA